MVDSVEGISFNPLTSHKKQDGPEKKHKKPQLISQREGKFYCTYVIGEDGKKRLISKIPIVETENDNISLAGSVFENIKNVVSHNIKNADGATGTKNQGSAQVSSHANTQEMIELLKVSVGIPSSLEGKQNLKK